MKILVVDDEIIQLKSMRSGLRTEGHEVILALNGEEALKQFQVDIDQFDLIITDYFMTGINGMDLIKAIRVKNKSIPVILMTAYGDKKLLLEALQNQCDGFIDKPFSLDQLLSEMNRVKPQGTGSRYNLRQHNIDPDSKPIKANGGKNDEAK